MIDVYNTDSVTWIQPSAVDKYGRAAGADTETTVQGRLEYHNKIIRTAEGREVTSIGFFEMKQQPKPGDKIKVGNETFLILSVGRVTDFGTVDWVAWFGNQSRVQR